jgi:hypothetical protein
MPIVSRSAADTLFMQQSNNTRLVLDQTVKLTILGDPEIRRTAKVKNTSGFGLGVEMAYPVGVGAALRIELNDAVLLGEAMYCRAEKSSYYVGIELLQGLCGLSELSRAVQAFTEERSGVTHSDVTHSGSNSTPGTGGSRLGPTGTAR